MIENEKYEEVLDSGLLLDHYLLLCNLKNGEKLATNKRIQGFINLLTKKDYIKDGAITEKGIDLVQSCCISQDLIVTNKKTQDFNEWTKDLHKRLQDKLFELKGKKQITARINGRGKPYSFLCNEMDLNKNLYKITNLYKIKDRSKIEKALFNYLTLCSNSNEWFPLLKYYIIKDGVSALVDNLDNDDTEVDNYKSTQKFV